MKKLLGGFAIVALAAATACGGGSGRGDRVLIQNKGSDTLVNVAQAWAEAFKEVDPNVAVAVSGGGSGTGISAMINGTVDIANASRKMKAEEIEAATANGHEPIEFIVGFDALAVFLHPDNPIDVMTIPQLAEIYGEGGTIDSWSQLGVTVPGCDSDEVVRVSRQNNSGTYVYFQESVLGEDRDFRLGSRDMHGSKDVVDLVENTPCAIGYSGLAYATDHVKMVPIQETPESEPVAPSTDTAIDGTYPIARPLMMYTAGAPQGAVKEYMDWVLSDEGQCIIKEKGYAPVRPVTCS
jgi:phosphate transport system substrate-binding protein